jgi:hypothetical protein
VRGRRWGGRAVLCLSLAVAAAVGTCDPAAAHLTPDAGTTGPIATFPQGIAPNYGSGLLRVGHHVYYEMVDEDGNTTIGRIDPRGRVDTATTDGSGYIFSAPTRTSDGGVWIAVDMGGAGAAPGDAPNLGVAGLDPATWQVDAMSAPAFTLDGWPSVADREGRFWTQGNAAGVGLVAVGAGLTKPLVAVTTHIGPLSSESDISINNPIVLGPDGRVWMLGGDGFGAGMRITSVGPAGIGVDVAPPLLGVGALALTRARGELWTVGVEAPGRLVAFGVDPMGSTTRVPTTLRGECELDAVQPVRDRRGHVWFTGADAECSPSADLLLAEVDPKRGGAQAQATGLTVLTGAVSTVLPVGGGMIVSGLDEAGNLAFARVGKGGRVLSTGVQPWVAPSQARYPLLGDGGDGAWAQAVDSDGKLVLVHVTRTKVDTVPTGLRPVAREFTVRPDGSLWTQGLDELRRLVVVKVRPNGRLTLLDTGQAPTQQVLQPVSDGRGHLWFRAADPRTGELVLVRVDAKAK